MTCDDLNTLFLRYRDTRDPEYMAEVFDRTAAKLHRLAQHLTVNKDQGDADDLLQATFLLAIEHCDRYQKSVSVLAWLSRIMLNEARMLRRRAGRRGRVMGGADLPLNLNLNLEMDAGLSINTEASAEEVNPHRRLEEKELSDSV